MSPKDQVRTSYAVLWDAHDKDAIPSLSHAEVTFRGSLGEEKKGHAGFAEYVDKVHEALGDYQCVIGELVAEGDKVFAKMVFHGDPSRYLHGLRTNAKAGELERLRAVYLQRRFDRGRVGARRSEGSRGAARTNAAS